jgi:hypothetical protein
MPATQIPAARRDAMARWLLHVYRERQRLADQLDPTRRHHVAAAIHFDAIATNASRAYWDLTGTHIHTMKGDS